MKHKQHDLSSTNVQYDGRKTKEEVAEAETHEQKADPHRREAEEAKEAEETQGRETAAADSSATDSSSTTNLDIDARTSGNGNGHLLGTEQRDRLHSRWEKVQASFVDHPRKSVSHADDLVKEATEALHEVFENGRKKLESAWDRGDEVSTEDLRVALKRYRSFFERVVSM